MSKNKRQVYKCPYCLQNRFFDDDCPNCTAEEKKVKSNHRQLIEFYHDMTLRVRGFKPRISPKDAKQLKNILELNILSKEELEKLILYFIADPSYNNLGPSMATMFSSTVINSLINKLKNRTQFYKELEQYASRYIPPPVGMKHRKVIVSGQNVDIGSKVNELRKKLSINLETNGTNKRDEKRGRSATSRN